MMTTKIITQNLNVTSGPDKETWISGIANSHILTLEAALRDKKGGKIVLDLLIMGCCKPWGAGCYSWHFWGSITLPKNRELLTADMIAVTHNAVQRVRGFYHPITPEDIERCKNSQRLPPERIEFPGWIEPWNGHYRSLKKLDDDIY